MADTTETAPRAFDDALNRIYNRTGKDTLRAHLEKQYGIAIGDTTELEGAIRVDRHDGPTWIARLFPAARPTGYTEGDVEILRHLEQVAYPAERCTQPEPISMHEGQAVLITDYVEGSEIDRSVESFRMLGELIGRLNTMPAESGALAREAGAIHHWAEGTARAELDAALSWLAQIAERVPSDQRGMLDDYRARIAGADDCGDLPHALIHPDPVPKNVIASPDGPVLIDWTGAGRGPRLAALAYLLMIPALRQDPGRIDALMAGYSAHVRLEDDELARLAGAIEARSLTASCFGFCLNPTTLPELVAAWEPGRERVAAIAARVRDTVAA